MRNWEVVGQSHTKKTHAVDDDDDRRCSTLVIDLPAKEPRTRADRLPVLNPFGDFRFSSVVIWIIFAVFFFFSEARHGTRSPTKKQLRELENLAGRLRELIRDAEARKLPSEKISLDGQGNRYLLRKEK